MFTRRKFPKSERLRNEILIASLFKQGKRFYYGGFVFIKLLCDNTFDDNINSGKHSNIQFFVGVRKKDFKHAVKRNKIRRLIKESYRNNKSLLENYPIPDKKILLLGVLYVGKTIPSYQECANNMSSFIKNNILK
ncbi:MAG: ribonuclease P protein component [Bacteroidales bacterium]|jgi:ribonuclease P protein component|nr:ribonuclease P protein component [Bacteroidales bacterium]